HSGLKIYSDIVSSDVINVFQMLYLVCFDGVIFVLFLYMLHITGSLPKKVFSKIVIIAPFAVNIILVIVNILTVLLTDYNVDMRISAYNCFVMAGFYIIFSIAIFVKSWRYIESNKRTSIVTFLCVLAPITLTQILLRETSVSSIGVTVIILGIYMNQEDPALREISRYHDEMIIGFANLIENRDGNTGGHVKRTSAYVKLISEGMAAKGLYTNVLTGDYINNLLKAAPMHDIGKIAIPDAILRKESGLNADEYMDMKLHAEKGGQIIKEAYKNLINEDFQKMAYEVARHHHEKWNGKGYPDGLSGEGIPLCARIMAVADVFDALAEKRCYRDALTMDECFDIIKKDSGQAFDPAIVETFVGLRDEVEKLHAEFGKVE
ncbi:MAG: HD domain-containing protein, partial [Ruminiclostridium sp.]|nr:HD domain-containing protein [Ruminiclostridium sp.]